MGKAKHNRKSDQISPIFCSGVEAVALTILYQLDIIQAPDGTGYDTIVAYSADLQEKMGFWAVWLSLDHMG